MLGAAAAKEKYAGVRTDEQAKRKRKERAKNKVRRKSRRANR